MSDGRRLWQRCTGLLAHVQCRAAVCLPLPLRPASQPSSAALQPDPVATEPLHSPLVESNDSLDCLEAADRMTTKGTIEQKRKEKTEPVVGRVHTLSG